VTFAARLIPVLLVTVVLHTAVAPQLRVFGVSADLLLLVAVATGLAAGAERGAQLGFLAGLLADSFLQTPFGLSALAYSVAGWGAGSFPTAILRPSWWVPAVTVALASAAGVALYAGAGAVFGQGHLVSGRLPGIIGVVAALNVVLSPVAVRVMRWAVPAGPTPRLVLR
jgi:rod shape-determining protein MreD